MRICSLMRSALLTGKSAYYTWYPSNVQVLQNRQLKPHSPFLFDASQPYQ